MQTEQVRQVLQQRSQSAEPLAANPRSIHVCTERHAAATSGFEPHGAAQFATFPKCRPLGA